MMSRRCFQGSKSGVSKVTVDKGQVVKVTKDKAGVVKLGSAHEELAGLDRLLGRLILHFTSRAEKLNPRHGDGCRGGACMSAPFALWEFHF